MVVDKIVTWFIQNVITPRQEIIDKPGFIILTISPKESKMYMRDLLLPEGLFEKIETKVVRKYGEAGKQALYSAGKKFGYVYASSSGFPQIGKSKEKDIRNFIYFLVRYVAGTYASDATYEVNLKTRTFKINLKDYVICRHDGIGLVMADGGIAGIWAWACDDPTMEGTQIKCQGRNDERCEVICAPVNELKKTVTSIFVETNVPTYPFDNEYEIKNQIRETTYSKNSLKTLLDGKFFEYRGGILSYKGRRMFLDDSYVSFILEDEICELPGGTDILFEAAFEEGKEIAEAYGKSDWGKFITDYLSALGFGDIAVLDTKNPKIGLIYYPWTKLNLNFKYILLTGFLSGIITQCTGKKSLIELLGTTSKEYLTVMVGCKK